MGVLTGFYRRALALLATGLVAGGAAALECGSVDRTATFPPAAREHPQIGYVRNLSAEGLLSLQPTLVLGEHDMGPPAVVDQLNALGLDLAVVPERFDARGIAAKICCVAALLGREAAGEALVAEVSSACRREAPWPRAVASRRKPVL